MILRASAVVLALIAGLLAGCGGAEDAREVARGSGAEGVTAVTPATQSAAEAGQATDAEDAGFAGALAAAAPGRTFVMLTPDARGGVLNFVVRGKGWGGAPVRLPAGEYNCRVQVRQYQADEDAGSLRVVFSGIAGLGSEAVIEPVGPEWVAEESVTVLAPEGRRQVVVRAASETEDAEWSVFCRYVRE